MAKLRTFSDRIGKTQGIAFKMTPPRKAKTRALSRVMLPRSLLDGRGKLVGFGEYYFRPGKRLRLARLIVAPERRGQRLINTLIGRLIRDALHQQSCTTVELAVFIDNRPAVHAYRRLGFQPIAERSAATALTMQRTIAS